MAAVSDLETVLAGLPAELTELSTDADAILAKIAAGGFIPDADIAALQAFSDGVKGISTQIEAALNPPAPAPAPSQAPAKAG